MYAIGLLGNRMFKRESLGGGDIKLSFIIGLILGFRMGLCALMLSTFLALPVSLASLMASKNNEIPYGPFLIGSLFVIFMYLDKFNYLVTVLFNL